MPRTKSQTIPTTTAKASRRWSREASRHHHGRVTRRSVLATARSSRSATRSSLAVAASRVSPGHGAGSPSAARSARLRVAVATCACWTSDGGGMELRPGSGVSAGARSRRRSRRRGSGRSRRIQRTNGQPVASVPRCLCAAFDARTTRRDAAGLLERRNEPLAVCALDPCRRPAATPLSSFRAAAVTSAASRETAASRAAIRSVSRRRSVEPLARPRRDRQHRHRGRPSSAEESWRSSRRTSSISPGERRSAWFKTTAIAAPCVCERPQIAVVQ